MKGEILKLLKETDGYISGQELCEKFGVSRTAVWKVINQLKEEGYEIEAVRNKGYILKGSADVLSKEELESTIHTKWAGTQVAFFEETDSTNNEIRRLAEQGAPHGTLAVAERQLGGKGQKRSCLDISGGRWDLDEHALKTTDRSHGGLHADARHGAVHEKGNREGDRIEI